MSVAVPCTCPTEELLVLRELQQVARIADGSRHTALSRSHRDAVYQLSGDLPMECHVGELRWESFDGTCSDACSLGVHHGGALAASLCRPHREVTQPPYRSLEGHHVACGVLMPFHRIPKGARFRE